MNPAIFETLMLICFGAAWPFSIYKMLLTKSSAGKSVPFITIILFGYIFGFLYQWIGDRDFVIYLYLFNSLMVMFDLFLTIKYRIVELQSFPDSVVFRNF